MDPSSHRQFFLEDGYPAPGGARHREGALRPATARDELRALLDFRVHLRAESFLPIILAQVTVRLGDLPRVDPGIFERLSSADLRILEGLYREMNGYPQLDERRP